MEWNKINVDNYKISLLDNKPVFLEILCKTKLEVNVLENVSCRLIIISNNNYDIDINLSEKANLVINSINKDNNVIANVLLSSEAKITYNHSVLANKDSINTFKINHLSDSSTSDLNNNGINCNENRLFFNIDGIIPKDLKNITCNQSSKIINLKNGNSKIIPNLIINSNDIIANHSAYIGEIGEEELFYMQSRGISDKDIQKLVYRAIMLGKMDLLEEKEKFNKIINEWW